METKLNEYDSTKTSRRINQQYNDEEMTDYNYKRYDQRSGGGGDNSWRETTSYPEWDGYDDRTKVNDKSYSSRGGQKWNSYDTFNKDRGANRYDENRTSYSGDRGDKYYATTGGTTTTAAGGGGGNRTYRYERDYTDNYDYNYPVDSKKTAYPDNSWQQKQDSRSQYSENNNGRRYEYSRANDRSYPPENDYEHYYNSKSRHEESYPRSDDWERKTSYSRTNNDDVKRSSYDDYRNSNVRSNGGFNNNTDNRKRTRDDYNNNNDNKGEGPRYSTNRGYNDSMDVISQKSNDYKRVKSYDDKSSYRYDEGSRDYDMQIGNDSSSELPEEPMWEDDKYGIKVHVPNKIEIDDSNDPWGIPASPTDPNHWDNSWVSTPIDMSNIEGNNYNKRFSSNNSRHMMMEGVRS